MSSSITRQNEVAVPHFVPPSVTVQSSVEMDISDLGPCVTPRLSPVKAVGGEWLYC